MPILDNPKHEAVCQAIAIGELTQTEAYRSVYGCTEAAARSSVSELLTKPGLRERIAELQAKIANGVVNRAVAAASLDRVERLARLERRAAELDAIIAERASDPELQEIPGGKTGHVWYTWKAAGKELCKEYGVDYAMLKMLCEVEKQAAQELGEWLVKQAVEVRDLSLPEIPADASIEDIRTAKTKMQEALNGLLKAA